MSPPDDIVPMWFQCDYPDCNAKYRRKEHLNRHLNHHNGETNLACPYCESVLTRNDLLRRHIRTYHPQRQAPPSRKFRACSACHARKVRCEGVLPCNACQHRGVICVPAGGETTSEQQFWIDDLYHLPPVSTIGGSVPDASRWIAHDYIDIYFDAFHSAWPFLHRSTFDFTKEPCVLVQSVVAIGLWVKGTQESREASIRLHGRLCSAFYAQMDQWCISDLSPRHNTNTSWPIATFQSVLLNIILALFIAREDGSMDLSMRCRLPDDRYELLTALVQSCRRWGIFSYPNMLLQHEDNAPLALVYISVEEIKRFGLALYKVSRLSTPFDLTGESANDGRKDLLNLADLSFCMPDSDDLWNAPLGAESAVLNRCDSLAVARDNGDAKNWISQASALLHDARVGFDWI
ncbi:hypothetical protein N7499_001153 [Penicillium canescens]|uniref:Uncharacterized protein n=1 Tax=Penicillium canescens TaxID=5083 RepID=A0AAD6I2J5_PENCN|nr:uncharacterized protein N7446_003709 [Penicillium canescens]KAJ6027695.1 hypothetical protein N7460_012512 [Penicillium canescens]KAJ6040975.1 hypothetical protein N7444_009880 [Penicillium canescens]KAJ6066672.1 hypothetical protein N7446_003709 [Penicillium canescens]KAJ6101523.1 hypothetical protein N7499_001153 [Penicillium canescens]KAJ6173981.1 hypothetical protein N7485_006793 [Penicillium canescens]